MPIEVSNIELSETLKKLFNCLLESVSEEGVWKDFDGSWNPIITAVTCELLLDAGMRIEDKWHIYREQYKPITIGKCIQYLNNQISEDGSFGTDLWDSLRLAKLIVANELKTYFSNYENLHFYILKNLETDDFVIDKSEWRGPGFLACAIDYLDLVKLEKLGSRVLEKLLFYQQRDGSWVGTKSKEGVPLISPVWHTSQAIITLQRRGNVEYRTQIDRAVAWLIDKQEADGSWPAVRQFEIYFTCYAILALFGHGHQNEITKAVVYLNSKIDKYGKCSDLGGTLMCALAFWEISKENINKNITFMEYLLASNVAKVMRLLEDHNKFLTNECKAKDVLINEFKQKYKDSDVVITKRMSFFLGIALAIIGLFSSLGGAPGLIQIIQNLKGTSSKVKVETPEKSKKDSFPGDTLVSTTVSKDSQIKK